MRPHRLAHPWIMAVAVALGVAPLAHAQPGLGDDFDWVTIGELGNPAYVGHDPPQGALAQGRGSVGYQYRITRTEVTTAQWLGFVNTFSTREGMGFFAGPANWGAEVDPDYAGPGRRHRLRSDVPNPGMLPVAGITWRDAAMFVNWLHNGRSSDLSAIADGAYDTSTFTSNPNGTFNDQQRHHDYARYWIPTLDEWMKAAHYDPDRYGPGQGGWWRYSNGSDQPLVYGPPGVGQANSQFQFPNFTHWDIPLGAYPDVRTPWGLLDAAGAAAEWLEEVGTPQLPRFRGWDSSWAGDINPNSAMDRVWGTGGGPPWAHPTYTGLRIVSSVPATGTGAVGALLVALSLVRGKRG